MALQGLGCQPRCVPCKASCLLAHGTENVFSQPLQAPPVLRASGLAAHGLAGRMLNGGVRMRMLCAAASGLGAPLAYLLGPAHSQVCACVHGREQRARRRSWWSSTRAARRRWRSCSSMKVLARTRSTRPPASSPSPSSFAPQPTAWAPAAHGPHLAQPLPGLLLPHLLASCRIFLSHLLAAFACLISACLPVSVYARLCPSSARRRRQRRSDARREAPRLGAALALGCLALRSEARHAKADAEAEAEA